VPEALVLTDSIVTCGGEVAFVVADAGRGGGSRRSCSGTWRDLQQPDQWTVHRSGACNQPRAQTIQGCRAYASIADVAEPVELAVVAVPAVAVNDVARECGACGVRALLVISAGFAEADTDCVRRQQQLLATRS
jgi:CoA binding domain